MIDPKIREFLNIPQEQPGDYLYITLPEPSVAAAGVYSWIQDNYVRGCLAHYHSGYVTLQVNNAGRGILNNTLFDDAIDIHGATVSGKVCVAVEVATAVLDADVPAGYGDNDTITEGEVTRQKTVRELMVCIEGTEGNSLILCAEKTTPTGNGTGLQHDELLRFRTQFAAYYVFTDEQLSAWKSNNIIGES